MKKNFLKNLSILLLLVFACSSCNFFKNTLTYEDTTKGFVESILKEDYKRGMTYMALKNEGFKNIPEDSIINGLTRFRELLITHFGPELNYKLISSKKTWSTAENESTPENITKAQVEFSTNEDFGVFEIMFDDNSNKILHIETLDFKAPIPDMTIFWFFGIIAICIPIFNFWVILKIRKSQFEKKWLKYIFVMILNVPSISFTAINGLSISWLNFQMLFGISFSYMGYLSSAWEFGIPLGGLYWFWKLNQKLTELRPEELKEGE